MTAAPNADGRVVTVETPARPVTAPTPTERNVLPSHVREERPRSAPPAAIRAAQVEANVQIENLASSAGMGRPSAASPATLAPAIADGGVERAAISTVPSETDGGDEARFTGRIVRGLSAMVNQRGGVMSMRLTPPDLGTLRVQMSIVEGQVNAHFTVTNEHARLMLDRTLTELRSALQSHGLHVEKLGVNLAASESSSTARHDGHGQPSRDDGSQNHDAAKDESRGRREDGEPRRHRGRRFGVEPPVDFSSGLDAMRFAERARAAAVPLVGATES